MTNDKAWPKKTYITAGIVSQKAWDGEVLYNMAYTAYNMHLSEVSQNISITGM